MGLLDSIQQFAASDEGMGLAQGLLSARGSAGLAAGLAGMNAAKEAAQLRQMRAMQVQQAQLAMDAQRRELARNQKLDELAPQFMRSPEQAQAMSMGPTQDGGSVAPVSPGFDFGGYANALAGIDPMKSIALQQSLAKETKFNKIDPKDYTAESVAKFVKTGDYSALQARVKKELAPSGQAYNPYTIAEGTVMADSNKPFAGFGPDGTPIANLPFQQYEVNKARAGAPNTQVKIENKMGEGIAAQVGPMLKESFAAANGAAQLADAANRVIGAVDSGKIFTGPAANARLSVAQIANSLGVTGKDEAEKIANTRQALRGLAEMTLQGRKQMSGQGAITNQESTLAERAISGDLSLTGAELKQIAQASARAAAFIHGQHSEMVGNLMADPNTSGLAKFYRPLPMPKISGMTPPAQQDQQSKVIDFGSLK